jgi:hypothetical protein
MPFFIRLLGFFFLDSLKDPRRSGANPTKIHGGGVIEFCCLEKTTLMHDKFGSIDMIMLSSSLLYSAIRWRRRLKVLGNRKKDALHEKSMYAKWLKTCIYKLIMYFSCIL